MVLSSSRSAAWWFSLAFIPTLGANAGYLELCAPPRKPLFYRGLEGCMVTFLTPLPRKPLFYRVLEGCVVTFLTPLRAPLENPCFIGIWGCMVTFLTPHRTHTGVHGLQPPPVQQAMRGFPCACSFFGFSNTLRWWRAPGPPKFFFQALSSCWES